MRAVQVTGHGEPTDVLDVRDVEVPEPGPGEVRIRVDAGALNFNDIARCRGTLASVTKDPPFTIGMDVTGVVTEVGSGAEGWIGRRVVAISRDALGGLAEYTVAPVDGVFDCPAGLTVEQAAAFLLPFHTTQLALSHRAGLRADETLLVHSGASGLGTAAIQLGAATGARVIATVSSDEKAELCRSLGAELVIDHTATPFADAVLDATDEVGADVVLDLAGGGFVAPSWQCTARDGRYLAVGYTDDPENGMTGQPLRMASIGNFSVVGVMCAWVDDLDPGMRRFGFNPFTRADGERIHREVCELIADGRVTPWVGRTVGFDDVGAALQDHVERRSVGRTVVVV